MGISLFSTVEWSRGMPGSFYSFLSSHRTTMADGRIITIFGSGRVAALKIDTGCGLNKEEMN